MTLELFISILMISASATSIAVEIIKIFLKKIGITYKAMPIAVIIAFIVGVAEVIIHTISRCDSITLTVIVYSLCMGMANTIGATVGYDTVKALICALLTKPKVNKSQGGNINE